MELALAVAVALASFIGLALLGFIGFTVYKYYVVLRGLRSEMTRLNSSMGGIPVLLEGIKAICAELATNTVRMTGSVDVLKKSLLDDGTSGPRRGASPGFIPYDVEAADAAYRIHEVQEAEAAADMEGRFVVE